MSTDAPSLGLLIPLAKGIAMTATWLAIGELRRGASAAWLRNWWRALFLALPVTVILPFLPARWMVSIPILHPAEILRVADGPILVPSRPEPADDSTVLLYPRHETTPNYAAFAAWIWAAAGVLLLARCAASARRARRLIHGAAKLTNPDWEAEATNEARRVGLESTIPLLVHENLKAPFAAGWLHPKIVLPAAADRWEPAKRRMVLQHEMAHIRNRDLPWQWFAEITCAIFWMNPLLWMAKRRLSLAQEMAADETVLNSGVCPVDYASVLTETALQGRGFSARESVIMAMAAASNLGRRIERTLDSARLNRADGKFVRMLTFAVAVLIVVGISGTRLTNPPVAAAPLGETSSASTVAPDLTQFTDRVEQQKEHVLQEQKETERLLQTLGIVDNDPLNASALITTSGFTSSALRNAVDEQQIQVDKIQARVESIFRLKPEELIEARSILGIDDPTITKTLSLLQDAVVEEKRATISGEGVSNPHLEEIRASKKQYQETLQDAVQGIRRAQTVGLEVAERTLAVLKKRLVDTERQNADGKAQLHEYVDAKVRYLEDKRVLENLQLQLEYEKKKNNGTDPASQPNEKPRNSAPNATLQSPGR